MNECLFHVNSKNELNEDIRLVMSKVCNKKPEELKID